MSSTKWDIHIYATCLLQRLQDHYTRGSRKVLKVRGDRWLQRSGAFWAEQGTCTDELTVM